MNYKYFLLSSQKIIIRAKIATAHQCKVSLRYAIEAVFYEAELTIKPKQYGNQSRRQGARERGRAECV